MATSAARAVLETMEAIDAPALAVGAGEEIRRQFRALPQVGDIRGLGLLLAVELNGVDARVAAARCLEEGLVLNGVTPTALRLAPPLIVTPDQVSEAVAILAPILEELSG